MTAGHRSMVIMRGVMRGSWRSWINERTYWGREDTAMIKLRDDEATTVQVRIRMLVLVAVILLVAGMAVLAIKEGQFSALVITLGCGFVLTEMMRRKGIFVWNWDPDMALRRIRMAETPGDAWEQICRALNSLHFDYARMSMEIQGKEKVFTWLRSEEDGGDPQLAFQVSLPLDRFGLGAGSLVVGKDVGREPITKEALAWIDKVKEDTGKEQR